MELPAHELRAFQIMLQAYALQAGLDSAQALLQRIATEEEEQPAAPPLRHVTSLFSSTSSIRRNWADFSDEEDE